jgi:carbonic anhydrase
MCENCESPAFGRRDMLKFLAVGLAASSTASLATQARAASGDATALTPDEALAALKAGNKRYVDDPQLCTMKLSEQRHGVLDHQAPWATIIGCADSRVPPELVFGGLGLGELFVARNAGNLVDTATMGTVEYGAAVLGSPLIVVLAHTSCGAVSAACKVVKDNATYPGSIGAMINPILPAAIAAQKEPGDFVNNAAMESARRTAAQLTAASSVIGDLASAGKLKIVSAIYDLDSGAVSYLE